MYMTITSFHFLIFVTIAVAIYYLVPKVWQWVALLIMSLIFYHYAARTRTIVFLLISTFTVYVCTMWMDRIRRNRNGSPKAVTVLAAITVSFNMVLWFVFKGYEYWAAAIKGIEHIHSTPLSGLLNMELVAALGMGYYTFQVTGYVLDCAWGIVKPQRNPLKLFLFVCFFPQLTTGPISRYDQLESLYQQHNISYQNITHGAQRVLWGFFKKLVLAERVGIIVSGITSNLEVYNGFYAWVAILLYPIQMYADFSGCMDIVIGVAEMFDIKLAENFKNPFFSRTVQEFWQRWHITLGAWAKNYVLYPLMKSQPMSKFGKFTRNKFGKSFGKKIATSVSLIAPWFVIGIWHGGFRFIVGVTLWNWTILTLGELLSPVFRKIIKVFNFRTDSFSWHFFQSARTYFIYAMGITFFAEGVGKGVSLLRSAAKVITGGAANPWIFFDGSILHLGIAWRDINLIIIAVLLLIIVGILSEKYGYARNWMDKQSVLFRWSAWIILFVLVLVYGKYGPEYHAADFIYQRF
ncbi:MAG: hypothetical protein J1E98_14640 [Lachnospiraceae bacterium]|nr:hypothetical protein [Lachnospiraceae bacterium]